MFNMLNMFRNFRDELFQPFIVHFKESLPAILRILTWDFTNPYGGFSECLPLVALFLICESRDLTIETLPSVTVTFS